MTATAVAYYRPCGSPQGHVRRDPSEVTWDGHIDVVYVFRASSGDLTAQLPVRAARLSAGAAARRELRFAVVSQVAAEVQA